MSQPPRPELFFGRLSIISCRGEQGNYVANAPGGCLNSGSHYALAYAKYLPRLPHRHIHAALCPSDAWRTNAGGQDGSWSPYPRTHSGDFLQHLSQLNWGLIAEMHGYCRNGVGLYGFGALRLILATPCSSRSCATGCTPLTCMGFAFWVATHGLWSQKLRF